jgi:hypothetical protein
VHAPAGNPGKIGRENETRDALVLEFGAINNAMVIASKFTPRNLTTFISGTLMRPSSTDK